MVSKYWDNPADKYPGASNHEELSGPDENGNERPIALHLNPDSEFPMVGDVGVNRKLDDE